MKKIIFQRKSLLAIAFITMAFTSKANFFTDFFTMHDYFFEETQQDTTPVRKKMNPKHEDNFNAADFDKAMKELDKGMAELDKEIKNIDFQKINKEIQESISKIDFDKIKLEIDTEMKKMDWNKINDEVKLAMKEAEIKMKDFDKDKFEKKMNELEEKLKSKKGEIKINAEKIKKTFDERMSKAKVSMEKAKLELQNLKDFTDVLEKDGLIDKKKGYKIKVQDGALYINGTKQSDETYEKYKQYYKKDKFTISSDGDNISSL